MMHLGLIQILIEKQSVFYREGCLKHQRQQGKQIISNGLDAGEHQEKWSSYPHIPEERNIGDTSKATETELQVSVTFMI